MNEYPRGERPELVHIDEAAFIAEPTDDSVQADFGEDDTQDCQPSDDSYSGLDEAKRFGNNRKHVKKSHAKIRRKIAKKSKQRNRK